MQASFVEPYALWNGGTESQTSFKRTPCARPEICPISINAESILKGRGTYLEEESDYEYLQRTHGNNQSNLNQTKIDNSLLGTVNSAEVSVLTCPEILDVSRNRRELAGDLEDGFLKD